MHIAVIGPDRPGVLSLAALAAGLGEAHPFTAPGKALAFCTRRASDLVVLHHPLGHAGTAAFMGALRASDPGAATPVLMVGPGGDAHLRADAFAQGADEFLALPVDAGAFAAEARELVRAGRGTARPQVGRFLGEFDAALAAREPRERELLFKLLAILVGHDGETSAHCLRVGFYARAIARGLGAPAALRDTILLAAPLHDMGKVLVPPEVIGKRGRFDAGELAAMRRHPEAGRRLLGSSRLPLLVAAAELAATHHECWDGTGYPDGRAGSDIPLAGRIVAIADVFDALVSARPYKPAWSPGDAVEWMIAHAGTRFDPDCVRAFCERWAEVLAVREAFSQRGGAAADAYVQAGIRQA